MTCPLTMEDLVDLLGILYRVRDDKRQRLISPERLEIIRRRVYILGMEAFLGEYA